MFGLFKKRHTVFFVHVRSEGKEYSKMERFIGNKTPSDLFEWIINYQKNLPKENVIVTCNIFTQ